MRIVTLVLALYWLVATNALVLQSEAIAQIKGVGEEATSKEHSQGKGMPEMGTMRIENPDGTLRPLPQTTMPESRISREGLREVPDAEGGTMVNVEGRFQSILQVPEGSDKAIHSHDSEDLSQTRPNP